MPAPVETIARAPESLNVAPPKMSKSPLDRVDSGSDTGVCSGGSGGGGASCRTGACRGALLGINSASLAARKPKRRGPPAASAGSHTAYQSPCLALSSITVPAGTVAMVTLPGSAFRWIVAWAAITRTESAAAAERAAKGSSARNNAPRVRTRRFIWSSVENSDSPSQTIT